MAVSQTATLVSLFSGAGGLDVGLERAGWRTVSALDVDRDCVATLEENRAAEIPIPEQPGREFLPGARLLCADIADVTARDLRPAGVASSWRPALLAGGPPCQPWSSAGLQRGFDDPRGRLFQHFVRLADELRPSFILMENVRGLVTAVGPSGKPGEALLRIQQTLEGIGYGTSFQLLNAADFGAAQRRVRLFVIASCNRPLPTFPEPTHADTPGLLDDRHPWVPLAHLLSTLPEPDPEDVVRPRGPRAAALAELAPGTGLRTSGRVESNRPGGHWGYRQDSFLADPSLPARTIRAATTPDWIRGHDGELRRLTWRECAALQGFPPEWRFHGTAASRFRQIGNAVQGDVAKAIGAVLLSAMATRPVRERPQSEPWPREFHKRVRYTIAEHRVNGHHRVRVRAAV